MFRFVSFFLTSVYSLMLKIIGQIHKHVNRSKSSLAEEMGSDFTENRSQLDDEDNLDLHSDTNASNETTEGSVSLVSKISKCQVISGENHLSGFLEEPKTMSFVVQELFVGSDNVVSSDQTLYSETSEKNDLFEKDLEEIPEGFDEELELSHFYFKLLNASFSAAMSEETGENLAKMENISENEKEEKPEFCNIQVERMNGVEDDEQDFSYEVELIPSRHSSSLHADEETDANGDDGISNSPQEILRNFSDNWMSSFLDQIDQPKSHDRDGKSLNSLCEEDLDDEYIELVPRESTSSSCSEAEQSEKSGGLNADQMTLSPESSEGGPNCWEYSDSDCYEDEEDVLSENQNLVQQMKMELKNCKIRGLPTISEEHETPKMVEDLSPLQIDHKIGYKDVMQEIQKFYKSYSEKMRKLDILNYQTSHAISFRQLKESQIYTECKKKGDLLAFVLPNIWPVKVRKIHADPIHKSMRQELELVYVGQVCLSWEILAWMELRAGELQEHDGEGKHSYNRAAEEFQQFQVLLQRFIEDEQFQGIREENYVRTRCMLRSLLQVPMIKDDCVKMKKERKDETDAITLEMLVEIIKESMQIFHEFAVADKKATDAGLFQEPRCSEVLSSLQKKERRMKEEIRRQKCIVKKLRKHVEERRWKREMLMSQVELRLVWRVLNMSRLSQDQLVWCQKKLNNISFVGRKVEREASFLLFPC